MEGWPTTDEREPRGGAPASFEPPSEGTEGDWVNLGAISVVAAAVGDRPVAAVVEGRRRPRRWGGVCGVCVCASVHDLREKRLC